MKRLLKLGAVLVVLYVAGCIAGAILLAELSLHVPRWTRSRAPFEEVVARDFHAALQSVSITAADGSVLRGWYVEPPNDNGSAVILLHGVGDNRTGMTGFARLFLQHGYRVLLPDSRAHGESGGAFATYGVKESDDIRRWVESLYAGGVDCVYGFGESMGAALVLQSIKAEPRYCAVIAESPFSTFRQVAYDRVGLYVGLGPWFGRTIARPIVDFALLYARWRYGVDFRQANPKDAIRASTVPVLLIHGEKDINILPWHSREMAKADRNAELWLVPGAAHCGASSVAKDEFDQRVLGWFANHSVVNR